MNNYFLKIAFVLLSLGRFYVLTLPSNKSFTVKNTLLYTKENKYGENARFTNRSQTVTTKMITKHENYSTNTLFVRNLQKSATKTTYKTTEISRKRNYFSSKNKSKRKWWWMSFVAIGFVFTLLGVLFCFQNKCPHYLPPGCRNTRRSSISYPAVSEVGAY